MRKTKLSESDSDSVLRIFDATSKETSRRMRRQQTNDEEAKTDKLEKRARGVHATYQTQTVRGYTTEHGQEPNLQANASKSKSRSKGNWQSHKHKSKEKQTSQCKSQATQRLSRLEKSVDRSREAQKEIEREKEGERPWARE